MPTAAQQQIQRRTGSRYPHLTGDLDADPELLDRLEKLASKLGKTFTVTSGRRTRAEQEVLYANRARNPYPVAAPGTSRHESGKAADVLVEGQPIQKAVSSNVLFLSGLQPLKGDDVHVELKGGGIPDPTGGAISDAATSAIDAAAGAVGAAGSAGLNVAEQAAIAAAKAMIGLIADLIGENGARILLYIVLVGGGTTAAVVGLSRAVGVRAPSVGQLAALAPPGRAAKAATVAGASS